MSYQLKRVVPRFAVNLELAISFYAKLGFKVDYNDGDFAIIKRDSVEFHINNSDDSKPSGRHVWWIEVADIDALYQHCLKSIPENIGSKPESKDYGFKEFFIQDPFCNLILFAQSDE